MQYTLAPQESACVEYLDSIGHYLDNNHWQITARQAGLLCKPYGLPRYGYARIVSVKGWRCEILRTITQGKQVWAVLVGRSAL